MADICKICGGPYRSVRVDGRWKLESVSDPYYIFNGVCFECHIARQLPQNYLKMENYINGNATCLPETGKEWLDRAGPKVRDILLHTKRRPRW